MTETQTLTSAEVSDPLPLAQVRGLVVSYGSGIRHNEVLHGVDFQVKPGQIVALVGESGCGKTTLANSLLGFLPRYGHINAGSVHLAGEDVTRATARELRRFRGRFVGYIPQDPLTGLNSTMTIGAQVSEAVRHRVNANELDIQAEVIEALDKAGLDKPVDRLKQFPHELSGGMRQRVLIAIALAGRPKIIIADEPTSALDVTVQARILDHLQLVAELEHTALMLITHNLALAADRADELVVMRNGLVVESGATRNVVSNPSDPYTYSLLSHDPGISHYADRDSGRRHYDPVGRSAILRLEQVTKKYKNPGASGHFKAVDDVSLEVHEGETVGLVGESGSGKSTILRIGLGLVPSDQGTVLFERQDIHSLKAGDLRIVRKSFQLVQQDPFSSLDPHFSVARIVGEPLVAHRIGSREERRTRVRELIDAVALPSTVLDRRPRELSGGQRQRVAIARALVLQPKLVLLDEPVSALDVSIQHQILDLLTELQQEFDLSYLFVSHDLAAVAAFCDRIIVLDSGRIVEQGDRNDVLDNPQTEYGQRLACAIPGHRAAAYVRGEL